MDIIEEHINNRVKNNLEDKLISIINEFKVMKCVECITFSSYYDPENGQSIAGLTMICDNENSRRELEYNNQLLEYVEDIKISLGFTTREEIINYRQKYFKLGEHIIIDKKDYKELQESIRDYKVSYDNLISFVPPLVLNKKNTR